MKKAFAVIMIAMMMVCFMPSEAFAVQDGAEPVPMTSGEQIGLYYQADDNTGALPEVPELEASNTQQVYEAGQVLVNKTITGTDTENVFDVNLEVITKDKIEQTQISEDAAVVLVIDISNSMDKDSRLEKAKEAAQAFVNSFAEAESTAKRKVAIVKFSGSDDDNNEVDGATTVQDWTDAEVIRTENKKTQCAAISDLSANGGTNIAAGLTLAQNLLDNPGDEDVKSIKNKNVILLTDGVPTFGIDNVVQETGTSAVCLKGENMTGNGYSDIKQIGWKETLNSVNHAIHEQVETIAGSFDKTVSLYSVYVGSTNDYMNCREDGCNLKPTKYEKKYSNLTSVSSWLSNDCGFTTFTASDSNKLTEIFKTISELIKLQARAWILTDPMGEYIDFVQFNTPNTNATYEDRTIRWDLKAVVPEESKDQEGNNTYIYNLSYKVRLNNLSTDFKNADETGAPLLYAANGVTKLTYFIQEEGKTPDVDKDLKTAYFNIPSVKGLAGRLEFTKADEDGNALAGAGFTLTANDNQNYKLTAESDENGKVTFSNIPSGHDYTLEETTVPTGYEKADNATISVAFGVVSGIAGGVITNYSETTSVKVSKDWNDNNNQDGKRPENITVQLLANNSIVEGESLVLNSATGWKGSFENLPKFKAGEEIVYTVEEVKVDGYTSEITGDAQNGFVITNSHTPETTSVSGSKIWKDGNNKYDTRPTSITINLMADGKIVKSQKVKENENGNWGWSFDNLPKYENGQVIQYSITEEKVPDYTPTYENNGNVVNTYTPGKTSVNVHKIWEDCDNQDGIRPQSVKVQLYANDEVVVGKELTLNADNKWTGSFTDLSATDDDGAAIRYNVKEVSLDSRYSSEITGSATTMFTITNTHTPETTSISGIKTWDDADNKAQKRPDSITINLLKNGEVISSKKVTSKEQWSWTFDNLAKYENGELIKYTISENAVTGYTPQYNGYDVTNTYKPNVNPPIGPTYTSVSVHKEWKLDDGGTAADSVTVQLYRNGVKYPGGEVKLSKENNWSYTWRPVYAYGDVWNVEEVNVPDGFTASVTKAAYSNDFTITNDDVKPAPENPADPTKPEQPTKPADPTKPTDPTKPAKPCRPDTEVPKTGDTAADAMLVNTFVLMLSALGGTALWHRRKQKNQISK